MARWLLVCFAMLWSAAVTAAEAPKTNSPTATPADAPDEQASGKPDGLPLPRFVSLRADSVNMRVGPNARYPIEWIYVRRNLPVEIVAEFDTWRRIKDPDGTEGWVHSSMLSGRRTAVVTGEVRPLLRTIEGKGGAPDLAASLEPGVIVAVERCPQAVAYCRVDAEGTEGWLSRDALWGVYPGEVIE
ncbi:MAG: SH3 domain-containing protein [Rhodospirillaceae bacterium]